MSSQKSILVGIDYSNQSINALREAARMANAQDLPLICYHVLDEDIFNDFKKHDSFNPKDILKYAKEKLAQFLRENIGTAHDIHTEVTIGNPFVETIKHIEKRNAGTLVLGSSGLGSEEHHRVGALATRCVRKAPCEVFLIRGSQDKPFKVIAACLDFSDNSIRAAHRAAAIASQDRAQLHLIHVYRPPVYADSDIGWLGPAFPMVQEPSIRQNSESQLEKIAFQIGSQYNLPDITSRVHRSSSVSKGISQMAHQIDAELVVLCTRGRTGFKKLLLGTAAEGIIRTTPCSILAVKPEDFHFKLS